MRREYQPCDSGLQIFNQDTCESIINYQGQLNCSLSEYYGLRNLALKGLVQCKPEFLFKADFNVTSRDRPKRIDCLKLCKEEFSKFSATVAQISGSEIPNEYLPSDEMNRFQRYF